MSLRSFTRKMDFVARFLYWKRINETRT